MIIAASESDLIFIEQITKQNMLEYYLSNSKAWDDAAFVKSINETQNLIVQIDDLPVAVLRYTLSDSYLYTNDLQVQASAQNQGHGAALLQYAFDLANRHALSKIRLCVFKKNSAFTYYQRFGFLHVGEQGSLFRMKKSFCVN